jgi:hypothetical protein
MPSSLVKVSKHFRGTHHLHLQGQSVSQARNYHKEGRACCLLHAGLLPGLVSDFEDGGYILLKCQLTSTELHGAIS